MCFANSVLQIMVYCPPFHRLFAESGRVLGGSGTSGVGSSGLGAGALGVGAGMNGMVGKNGDGTGAEASAYPLVDATVEFLKEFVVDDDKSKDLKEKGKASAISNLNRKVASGSASGSGSSSRTSSSRGGKGRERGHSVHDVSGGGGAVGRREDDDGWTESFLLTYVYDAMKVKKRFEHMQVSFSLVSSFFHCSVVSSFPFLWCGRQCRPLVHTSLLKIHCYPHPDFE